MSLKHIFGRIHGLDQRSVDIIIASLEKANLPGFDYLEFKQSLEALANLNMDEITAIRSAFATASTMGLTKEKLLDSAAHYRTILEKEKEKFEAAVNKQIQDKVDGKLREAELLKTEILKAQQKITELQAQITEWQSRIGQWENTVDTAADQAAQQREKIEATRSAFEYTLQSILNQIDRDADFMRSHL